jgi:hypothetical protein
MTLSKWFRLKSIPEDAEKYTFQITKISPKSMPVIFNEVKQ